MNRCYRCLRPLTRCYCSRIEPFSTRTRLAICIHPDEYRRQKSGTGRLASIALKESRLFVGIDFTHHEALGALLADPRIWPWLLYPGSPGVPSLDLSKRDLPQIADGRELLVILIDGTWRQARKILNVSANLRALPRLAFSPENPSRFLFKRQPKPECLSTIEAIYELLGALERHGRERLGEKRESLLAILSDLVAWQVSHREKSLEKKNELPSAGKILSAT